jgi:hypothetical protein
MVRHQGHTDFVSVYISCVRSKVFDETNFSKLLETAEKMGWPQPIEYRSISSDDRTHFESAFLDLLKLQDAYVYTYLPFSYSTDVSRFMAY